MTLFRGFNYHSIIEDFIISEKMFNNRNLETIYNILQFANDIEDFKYYYIAEVLANSKPIENDYHEFYKLFIFDLIINKHLHQKDSNRKIAVLNKIFFYIKDNDIKNHLISIYMKLSIDLSLFYSESKLYLEKAKELYFLFKKITNNNILQTKYNDICNKIMLNIKNLESEKEILDKHDSTNNDNVKNIIAKYILDDDEYELHC